MLFQYITILALRAGTVTIYRNVAGSKCLSVETSFILTLVNSALIGVCRAVGSTKRRHNHQFCEIFRVNLSDEKIRRVTNRKNGRRHLDEIFVYSDQQKICSTILKMHTIYWMLLYSFG